MSARLPELEVERMAPQKPLLATALCIIGMDTCVCIPMSGHLHAAALELLALPKEQPAPQQTIDVERW